MIPQLRIEPEVYIAAFEPRVALETVGINSENCGKLSLHVTRISLDLEFYFKASAPSRICKEPPARKGFLALDKFQELLKALLSHLRPLITFLYFCGVRLGEALQIEWSQVDLKHALIVLHEEQTKNADPRTIPIPSPLLALLRDQEPKVGRVFDHTNLRTEWARACSAMGLGTMKEMISAAGWVWHKYVGLNVHDLRRSAVRNLRVLGKVPEGVAMKISGHKTRAVFDRYNIVTTEDVSAAMRAVEVVALKATEQNAARPVSAKLVQIRKCKTRKPKQTKLLATASD